MNSVKLETTAENKQLKTQILTIWMNWEKLCPNLSLLENEIGNLHKPSWSHNWSHFKVNTMNDVFSNFKNQSMNCDKYVFNLEKWNFEPTANSALTAVFLI